MKVFFRVIRRTTGTIFFMVGVVALALPILPGWLLIGIGLYLLSIDSPGMQTRIVGMRKRYQLFDVVMRIFDDKPKKEK